MGPALPGNRAVMETALGISSVRQVASHGWRIVRCPGVRGPGTPSSLDLGQGFERLAGLIHGPERLDPLPAACPDPPPATHEGDSAEQVPLDHQAVEPRDPQLRIDTMQHQGVLDWGAIVVHRRGFLFPAPGSLQLGRRLGEQLGICGTEDERLARMGLHD